MNFLRRFKQNSRLVFYGNCCNKIRSDKFSIFYEKNLPRTIIPTNNNDHKYDFSSTYPTLLGFSFAFFKKDTETPEEKLVNTIKSSIISIGKFEYDKAEQILHLALRMAQDMQNRNGITYVYDLMANLAMEREQYEKSEKLFVDVLKRLMQDGLQESNAKILHISSKLAHIAFLQGAIEKSVQGFEWTINKISESMKATPEDKDLRELLGLTKNWYGQLLMDQEKFEDAKNCFSAAYNIYTAEFGPSNPEAITMLNNLSVVCSNLGDIASARNFLEEALELAHQVPDWAESGVLKANLGLLYLKSGLVEKARETCSAAWKYGRKKGNKETLDQSEYCLEKIKAFTAQQTSNDTNSNNDTSNDVDDDINNIKTNNEQV